MKSSILLEARKQWQQRNILAELSIIEKNFKRGTPENLYKYVYKRYSWILKTIEDQSLRKKLKLCNKILLVGSGMYPYSLFDMHKRFPNIKYYGIEISLEKVKLARLITDKTPAKNDIEYIHADGFTYDYKDFGEHDLIFISCDVDVNPVMQQIAKTSGAQFWVCAPYEKVWIKNLISTK